MLRLTIRGAASAQLLRVVNLLAQRGLVPVSLNARTGRDEILVVIELDMAAGDAVEILAEKLRSLVEADEVTVAAAAGCPR